MHNGKLVIPPKFKLPPKRKGGPRFICGFCGDVFRSRRQRMKHTSKCGK